MGQLENLLLSAHLFSTFALTGLIWIVQVVHYPLFAKVGRDVFTHYHAEHVRRITWVVAPLMVIEMMTATLLVLFQFSKLPSVMLWLNLLGIGLVWLATAAVSVPFHRRLEQGFALETHGSLVTTNWIRTVLWTGRSGIWFVWLAGLIS